jgi:hypothetical protein
VGLGPHLSYHPQGPLVHPAHMGHLAHMAHMDYLAHLVHGHMASLHHQGTQG